VWRFQRHQPRVFFRAASIDNLHRQHGAHPRGYGGFVVEQPERRKIGGAARVIAPALSGADQDAGIRADRALAHLDIQSVVVERDLARHRDPARV
jgi:hypothetical protein